MHFGKHFGVGEGIASCLQSRETIYYAYKQTSQTVIERVSVETEALETYSSKTVCASVPMGKSPCNLGIRFPKILVSRPHLEEMGRGKHRTLDTGYLVKKPFIHLVAEILCSPRNTKNILLISM